MDNNEGPKSSIDELASNVNGKPNGQESSEVWNPPYGVLMLKLIFDTNRRLSRSDLCFVVSELPKTQEGKRAFNVLRVAGADRNSRNNSFVDSQLFPDNILNKELVDRILFGSHYEYKLPVKDNDLYEFIRYLPPYLRDKLRVNITEGEDPNLKVLVRAEKDRLIATINKVAEEMQASRRDYSKSGRRRF